MTVQEALNQGKKFLTEKNIDEASLITRMLLSYVLKCKKEELLIRQEEIQDEQAKVFLDGIEKISNGYPIQYITHSKEFIVIQYFCSIVFT